MTAILNGEKTTTTCLLAEFKPGEDPHNEIGELEAVVNSDDEIVCVTRTVNVRVVRLGEVSLDHAMGEGEGYTTVAEWRAGHEKFWTSSPSCVMSEPVSGPLARTGAELLPTT